MKGKGNENKHEGRCSVVEEMLLEIGRRVGLVMRWWIRRCEKVQVIEEVTMLGSAGEGSKKTRRDFVM
jgi:hypothetical protein